MIDTEKSNLNTQSSERGLADFLINVYDDPLRYVMYMFPWNDDPSIQLVSLPEAYRERFPGIEYGPDQWACEFLDDLGREIKERKFNGKDAVPPIRFSTASGHGIGKSTLTAWIIKFLLDTRPFSIGMVTANTSDQLRTKTWAQVGFWNAKSLTADSWIYRNSRGNMSLYRNTKSDDIRDKWRCDAQTCREENSEAFAGLHAANSTAFYIFDEASAVPDPIFDVREGGATDGEPMSFDFGNPTRKSGRFYENTIGKFRHRYITRSIDSRDVSITNKALFEEWRNDWGEDSDFFKVRVKGVFPSAGSVQFINSDEVEQAMFRLPEEDKTAPLIIGVDVARFGDNSTIIYPRVGNDAKTWGYWEFRGLDIVGVVEAVVKKIDYFKKLGKTCEGLFIDGGGLGGGVVDMLSRLRYNPIDVNFGGKSFDPKYRLKVDQMWGNLRDNIPHLCLPRDDVLRDQLTQREYGFTATGKIALESKKDMEDRGVMSPDVADALALTYAHDVGRVVEEIAVAQIDYDYDPLEAA